MKRNAERRSHIRYPGQTLLLEVDGLTCPLIDISTGGISFEGEGFHQRQTIMIKLSSVLDGTDTIGAECEVAMISGVRIGAAFTRPTLPLMAYIIGHIAAITGTSPCVVKRDATSLS